MLEPCLEDLEQRIDPEVERALYAEWVEFTDGGFGGDVFRASRPEPAPPAVEWPEASVNEALGDFEKMALQQFATCSRTLEAAGGELLCVRCNYGTGIIPSLFGAELFVMPAETDTLPTVRPLEGGPDAARRLLDAGSPDLHAGLGGKVFRMAERYLALMERYPKIGRHVRLYHPDTQGPMDVCELLLGSDLFTAVVDEPGLVKDLLELVTGTYVRFMREWQELVPFEDGRNVHWGLMHGGRIMLRDDSAMNFSPGMFEEFIRPYDRRLLEEFGGGALHFCGRGDHYIRAASQMDGLHAVNLSQPECNDMEEIFRWTVDRGINVIGLPAWAAEDALAAGRDLRGRVHATPAAVTVTPITRERP